ncbi:MAG TPA: hypothetical protein VF646_11355 [Cytophagales bacterium]
MRTKCTPKGWLPALLVPWLFSCSPSVTGPDYGSLARVVGPQGGTVQFFPAREGRNIPQSLLPQLQVAPGTFNQEAVLRLGLQLMTANHLPPALTNISGRNYKWEFEAAGPAAGAPITLTVPFDEPDEKLWLGNYVSRFRLYRIRRNLPTTELRNWEPVPGAQLDTVARRVTAPISDFGYGYCVLFEEIRRSDNVVIRTTGPGASVQAGTADGFFSPTLPRDWGLYHLNDTTHYRIEDRWNDDFELDFSFAGRHPGTYAGDQVRVTYRWKKEGNAWVYHFWHAGGATLRISRFGGIGAWMEGTLTGTLVNQAGQTIDIASDFKLIRTR